MENPISNHVTSIYTQHIGTLEPKEALTRFSSIRSLSSNLVQSKDKSKRKKVRKFLSLHLNAWKLKAECLKIESNFYFKTTLWRSTITAFTYFRLLNRHLRFVRQECDVDLFEGFDLFSGERFAEFIEQLLRAYWHRVQATMHSDY